MLNLITIYCTEHSPLLHVDWSCRDLLVGSNEESKGSFTNHFKPCITKHIIHIWNNILNQLLSLGFSGHCDEWAHILEACTLIPAASRNK